MKKVLNELKRHALTAISYMLPLVVASGLLIAIGNLMGGEVIEDYTQPFSIASSLTSLGVLGMGLLAPFISGYIAYSIAERPGIAPGFLMGLIANALGAGFLGGMVGGYLIGYFVLWMRNTWKIPKWAEGLMPMMIIPTISSIVVGLFMFFVVGVPIRWFTEQLINFLENLDESSRIVYGFVFGVLGHIDYGGPISKVPNLFADGLLLEGVLEPEAIKVIGGIVPPVGITFGWLFSKLLKKRIFTKVEEDAIKVAFPMGLTMITEGVIPIAMNDLLRTLLATGMGTGVAGAINFYFQNGSPVPSGGIFVIPAMTKPFVAVSALLIGSIVTGLILVLIKKRITEEEYQSLQDEKEEETDLLGFSIEG